MIIKKKDFLYPKDIANHFGVTLSTVRRWVKDGILPAIQTPGGHSRILVKEFQKFLIERDALHARRQNAHRRLLIVDDNQDILSLLATLFTGKGYDVTTAGNGAEALARLNEAHFPFVLSDVMMPVMDGRKLLNEIKAHHRRTKVVMMSSNRSFQLLDFQLAGAIDILFKPMGLSELYDTFKLIEKDKRAAVRVPVSLPLRIDGSTATSINISADGMLVNADKPLAPGTAVMVDLLGHQAQPLCSMQGTVIRSTPLSALHTTALYFTQSIGQRLTGLLNEHLLAPTTAPA
jgi:excisionase family DNA binding protein